MQLTVLRPSVRTSPNYQVGLHDYVSVSHLDVRGTWTMADTVRFGNTSATADPRNVTLFNKVFKGWRKNG